MAAALEPKWLLLCCCVVCCVCVFVLWHFCWSNNSNKRQKQTTKTNTPTPKNTKQHKTQTRNNKSKHTKQHNNGSNNNKTTGETKTTRTLCFVLCYNNKKLKLACAKPCANLARTCATRGFQPCHVLPVKTVYINFITRGLWKQSYIDVCYIERERNQQQCYCQWEEDGPCTYTKRRGRSPAWLVKAVGNFGAIRASPFGDTAHELPWPHWQ